MAKDSFQKQFPDYPIIPSKRWKIIDPIVLGGTVIALVAVFGLLFLGLSKMSLPTPLVAGYNDFSLETLRNQAMAEANAGQHATALRSFSQYFQLGGQDADAMAVFALSLDAQGKPTLADEWSKKALAAEPESKAAKFVREVLDGKQK